MNERYKHIQREWQSMFTIPPQYIYICVCVCKKNPERLIFSHSLPPSPPRSSHSVFFTNFSVSLKRPLFKSIANWSWPFCFPSQLPNYLLESDKSTQWMCDIAEFQGSYGLVISSRRWRGTWEVWAKVFAMRSIFFHQSLKETSPHEWAGLDFVTLLYQPFPSKQPISFSTR